LNSNYNTIPSTKSNNSKIIKFSKCIDCKLVAIDMNILHSSMDEWKFMQYYIFPQHLNKKLTWITNGIIVVNKVQRTQTKSSIDEWMKSHIGIPFIYEYLHKKLMWIISCIWVAHIFINIWCYIQLWVFDVSIVICPITFTP
jgi:hypothetical protein